MVAKQTPAPALSDVNVFCNKNTAYVISFLYRNNIFSQLVGKNKGDIRICYIVNMQHNNVLLQQNPIVRVGNGLNQQYFLKGYVRFSNSTMDNIVPFVAPDIYTDTLTATISY